MHDIRLDDKFYGQNEPSLCGIVFRYKFMFRENIISRRKKEREELDSVIYRIN